ncbi:MAG TPA: cytochrome D1 domain-containing protein [Bryobacteraceae bacterium]|nr:cytochrome D1 domain-containing protein [Bryobacteraceae bacterium]
MRFMRLGFLLVLPLAASTIRIIQTNSAGDNVHIIDPATDKVVGEITGIEVNHGAAAAPDGARYYISNEAESTLDVVDAKSLKITRNIKLSGRPNNIAVTPDGKRVYVSIIQAPGAVDVIDTASLEKVKTIPMKYGVHNTYVTPDGKFVVAGSVVGKLLTVIDRATEEKVWELPFDNGVRPIAFEKNADGSTHRLFIELSNVHGFAVVDFAARKEVARVNLPAGPAGKKPDIDGTPSHGIGVSPDGKTLWVNSSLNNAVYCYSLPDLKLKGTVEVGRTPDWLTFTPDSRKVYVSNAGANSVSAIDVQNMKELTRIKVGYVPKRNITAVLP